MIYLSDRRQKLAGAIAALDQPLPSIDSLPPLKTVTTTELIHYPSVPMTDLTPEELVRVSQIVYTALIKVYLMIRPSLVGSLCRIENWCEVEEVEELLKERSVRDHATLLDDVLITHILTAVQRPDRSVSGEEDAPESPGSASRVSDLRTTHDGKRSEHVS
jgi:hypothetical protein